MSARPHRNLRAGLVPARELPFPAVEASQLQTEPFDYVSLCRFPPGVAAILRRRLLASFNHDCVAASLSLPLSASVDGGGGVVEASARGPLGLTVTPTSHEDFRLFDVSLDLVDQQDVQLFELWHPDRRLKIDGLDVAEATQREPKEPQGEIRGDSRRESPDSSPVSLPTSPASTASPASPASVNEKNSGQQRVLHTLHLTGLLVELPTIIEALKSMDKETMVKSATVSQMIIVIFPDEQHLYFPCRIPGISEAAEKSAAERSRGRGGSESKVGMRSGSVRRGVLDGDMHQGCVEEAAAEETFSANLAGDSISDSDLVVRRGLIGGADTMKPERGVSGLGRWKERREKSKPCPWMWPSGLTPPTSLYRDKRVREVDIFSPEEIQDCEQIIVSLLKGERQTKCELEFVPALEGYLQQEALRPNNSISGAGVVLAPEAPDCRVVHVVNETVTDIFDDAASDLSDTLFGDLPAPGEKAKRTSSSPTRGGSAIGVRGGLGTGGAFVTGSSTAGGGAKGGGGKWGKKGATHGIAQGIAQGGAQGGSKSGPGSGRGGVVESGPKSGAAGSKKNAGAGGRLAGEAEEKREGAGKTNAGAAQNQGQNFDSAAKESLMEEFEQLALPEKGESDAQLDDQDLDDFYSGAVIDDDPPDWNMQTFK